MGAAGSTVRRVLLALGLLVGSFGVAGLAFALPERCGDASPAALDGAVQEMIGWLDRNQRPDGRWLYWYDPHDGVEIPGYNWVRHAGVLKSLEQAALAGFAEARPVAERGWEAAARNLYRYGGRAALADPPGELTTGGTALLTVALADRRAATGDRSRDADLLALGRYLAGAVRADGAVEEDGVIATGELIPDRPSTFTTGEAMYALARLHVDFPDEGFAEPVRRIGRYLVDDRAVAEGYVPDISEHWGAYGFALIRSWPDPSPNTLSDRDVAWIRRQMGLGSIQVRYDSQRTDAGLFLVLRGHRAPASGMGTVAEALGGWYRTAVAEPRLTGEVGRLAERLACGAGLLVDRQVTAAESVAFPNPDMVRGAVITSGEGRMDDQQHALSGVLAAREALADTANSRPLPRRHPAPESWLLVTVAAFAALNPFRIGRAAGTVAGGPAAAGLVAVGALAVGAAALGGPILDALSLSDGSAIVAAGVVLVLGGLVTIGPWALRRQAAGGGWRDALVPVAVPVALRAEVLVLAVACGAGGRGWPFSLGAALAVATAWAVSRWRPTEGSAGDRVQRWAAQTVALATVALGIGVIVEGAFTI
jgi:hypothetical protein